MKDIRRLFVFAFATVALMLSLPFFYAGRAFAQEDGVPPQDPSSNERKPGSADGDLIGRLNLTPDQIKRIRAIRQQSAEEMRAARQRMTRAQFELDEAVYADSVDEIAIESHARELASAQAAVTRFRALTELRIRRLLTPEQLSLLREIRHQARARGLGPGRNFRRDPSVFPRRALPKAPESDQNGVGPGTSDTPRGTTGPGVRKP